MIDADDPAQRAGSTPPARPQLAGHHISDARDHGAQASEMRPPLPAQPAPSAARRNLPFRMQGSGGTRAPFLPDHHGHASHCLKG